MLNCNKNNKMYVDRGGKVMYLDPGFGGMILQVIVALVAVGGAIVYSARRKIKELFSKKKDGEVNEAKTLDSDKSKEADEVTDMLD